jgi:hypothetical protein
MRTEGEMSRREETVEPSQRATWLKRSKMKLPPSCQLLKSYFRCNFESDSKLDQEYQTEESDNLRS